MYLNFWMFEYFLHLSAGGNLLSNDLTLASVGTVDHWMIRMFLLRVLSHKLHLSSQVETGHVHRSVRSHMMKRLRHLIVVISASI